MLFRVTREVLTGQMTLKRRPNKLRKAEVRAFWAEETVSTKAQAEVCLGCSRDNTEANVPRLMGMKRRAVVRDKVTEKEGS